MNPIRSLILTLIMVFSLQNASFADVASHKLELQKAQQSVDAASIKIDKTHFYPQYHIAAPANRMNNPGGLSYFNGQYHLFYQHNPYSVKDEKMHSGHYVSPDLVHWKEMPIALAPSEDYDKNGVFSGSAIVHDGILSLLYTGNVENKVNDKVEKHQTQNLLHGMCLLLTGQFIFCIDFSWLFMQSRMRFKSTYLKKGIRLLSLMASPPFLLEFFFVGVIRETVAAQGPHRSREHLAFLSKLYHIDRSIWQ